MDIRKNRYDGSVGSFPLGFDKDTKRYFELEKQEYARLIGSSRMTIDNIKKARVAKNKVVELPIDVP
jgi:hypothetical protein